jgi:hypothetical protein
MQRLSVFLHGTLGSHLRDFLHEGGAAAVACFPAPRTQVSLLRPLHSPYLDLVDFTAFFVINFFINRYILVISTKASTGTVKDEQGYPVSSPRILLWASKARPTPESAASAQEQVYFVANAYRLPSSRRADKKAILVTAL